jgi:hypothetical protein
VAKYLKVTLPESDLFVQVTASVARKTALRKWGRDEDHQSVVNPDGGQRGPTVTADRCNKTDGSLALVNMMTFASHWRFGAAAVMTVMPLAAQQDAVFQSDTRVVEIAVVAKDANDSSIADLRQRDLRVYDNGVEQAMLSFENLGVATRTMGVTSGGGISAVGTATSRATPRLSIILLDALNTSVSSQIYGRKAISEMLGTLPPGENRIAIFVLGDELRLCMISRPTQRRCGRRWTGMKGNIRIPGP